jgi:LacI family transcriptional regulator
MVATMTGRPPTFTLKDVAAAAGVHVSTASRALDPAASWRVSDETVERIRMAADRLGYVPDMMAKGLKRGTTTTIGVVVADFENPFLGPILRGIGETIERKHYVSLVTDVVESHDVFARVLDNLLQRRVGAIITTAARLGDRHLLTRVADAGVPVILAVRDIPGSGLPTVTQDDHEGGALAAGHLIDLGHQVLAQLRGPADIAPFAARAEGFRRRIGTGGLVDVSISEQARAITVAEGRRLMDETLRANTDRIPTAIFAHADLLAVGAVQALRAAGRRCPEDVSVIGYDDLPLADCLDPPLSTITLPGAEIGRLAGELAIACIEDPTLQPDDVRLPATLVARGSSGPPGDGSRSRA